MCDNTTSACIPSTAAGCVAVGIDPVPARAELARAAGFYATTDVAELTAEVLRLTGRRGADGVLVTAASRSNGPLESAIALARERAVVSIVGDIPVETPRTPLFAKELRLVVSRSYGPGRYDPAYEERGHDYPAGYVRWTEGRNLAEVLRLMASGQLRPGRLTTHTFDLADGADAYALLDGAEPSLGILLRYPETVDHAPRTLSLETRPRRRLARGGRPRVGVIGAGAFARTTLLPSLRRGADVVAVANATGPSARSVATNVGARLATTDHHELLADDAVEAVVIATRHDTHAGYVIDALEAGKHVFVEKPLALDETELAAVEAAAATADGVLMVGFNRRYAPLAVELRDALGGGGPLVVGYRIAAGRVPRSHWTQDREIGGGRIVGEVCHFVDLVSFLTGSVARYVSASAVGGGSEPREDNVVATLNMSDGSVATITYAAMGDGSLAKERVEVLGERGAGVLDDFRALDLHRDGQTERKTGRRDKGHAAEIAAFLAACRDGVQPRPVADLAAVMRTTYAIRERIAVVAT